METYTNLHMPEDEHLVKKEISYTEEEVSILLLKCLLLCLCKKDIFEGDVFPSPLFNNWWEQNKKKQ